ncbi:MAG: hypothetical protein IPL71_21920 [Anaerolineales bacterium]|uniref:hypothetical protein n=1 Tax=Candidatus Villigracilis proximus TaxID=3140683 RepID=UPI003134F422|nr:hypothetical protein [Anaerolineales bacterium]
MAFAQNVKDSKARYVVTKTTPSERGEVFSIPVLAYRQGKYLEQLEETHFHDYEWELPRKDANLTEAEFSTDRPAPKQGEVDVSDEGKVKQVLQNLKDQLSLLKVDLGWKSPTLSTGWIETFCIMT